MKTTKTLLTILITLLCLSAFAQQHPEVKRTWHWYFGWNAGLDFSSGTMQEDLNGQVYIDEGSCSISDTSGNLLFYAGPNFFTEPGENNMTVYNANHEVMQNGTDIDCGWSGRQNSIIVPLPESNNIYYLFTIGDISGVGYNVEQTGFKYNIVDMSLNGGLGAVTDKNIEIYSIPPNDTLSEILTAVHHANCKNVWIVMHSYMTDVFRVYKLTSDGLDTNVVINQIGNSSWGNYHTWGWGMKFSPNGKYAAVNKNYMCPSHDQIRDTLELYKFDNETGILSDRIAIQMDSSLGGKEFSFVNDLLYTEEMHQYTLSLFQYDISKWQKQYIMDSKTLIGNYFFPIPDLHLTPLNTIIMSGEFRENIGVIEHPDVLGIGCSVNENGFYISNNPGWNFPNFVRSYFNTDSTAYNCNQVSVDDVIKNQFIEVYPNPFDTETEINTNNREIIYYNLYDLKGNRMILNRDFKLRKTDDAYVFINKKLKGGIYILSGMFADKEQFNIKLNVNN
jgi:hypothetical protein